MVTKLLLLTCLTIQLTQLNAQKKKPSDSISNIFGDLLKSAGKAPVDNSDIMKAPSLLHDLVKNVKKKKENSNENPVREFSDADESYNDKLKPPLKNEEGFDKEEGSNGEKGKGKDESKPPSDADLFGDLLKSAGKAPPDNSDVTKAPSFLHDLVKNLENKKREKSEEELKPDLDFKFSDDKITDGEKSNENDINEKEEKREKEESGEENIKGFKKSDKSNPLSKGEGFENNKKEIKPPSNEEGFYFDKNEEENIGEKGDSHGDGKENGSDQSKPALNEAGINFPRKEEKDESPDKTLGEEHNDSIYGEEDFDFSPEPGLKPVRPPPPIELEEDYGYEEYSNEDTGKTGQSPDSSSEDFGPAVPEVSAPGGKRSTKIKKLKPKQKQWCSRDKNCEDGANENWISFSDLSPSTLCSEAGGEVTETCLFQRLRPEGRVSLKCGECRTVFIPTTVEGVDIKDRNDAKKKKTEKLRESGSVTKSKLSWIEVDSAVESCPDETSSSQEERRMGSPSVLCESGDKDKKCLCAMKDERVKLVCGECKISLKLK